MGEFSNPRSAAVFRALLVAAAVIAAALFWLYREPVFALLTDVDRLRAMLLSIGPWGPVAIALLYALQLVIAPIPGNAVAAIAGFLYGPWLGLGAVAAGGALGSGLAMMIGRRFGRPLVDRYADARIIAFVDRFSTIRAPWIWAVIFLLPLGDPLVFAAGLTTVPLLRILPGIVVGRLPGQALLAYMGSEITETVPIPLLVVLGGLTLASVLAYLHLDRLKVLIGRLAARTSKGD